MCCNNSTLQQLYIFFFIFAHHNLKIEISCDTLLWYSNNTSTSSISSYFVTIKLFKFEHCKGRCPGFQRHILYLSGSLPKSGPFIFASENQFSETWHTKRVSYTTNKNGKIFFKYSLPAFLEARTHFGTNQAIFHPF